MTKNHYNYEIHEQIQQMQIMKRAWNIDKGNTRILTAFLLLCARLGRVASNKRETKRAAIKAKNAAAKAVRTSNADTYWTTGAIAYYSNVQSGQYLED